MKKDNNKQVIMLSVVVVITLIIVVIGATYAYFQTTSGAGSSTDVNVITATTDLLTFKIDKEINISLTQSDLKKGNGSVSDSTKASATLTASNSKDVDKTTGRYNIYFIIENNDFEYTTSDAKPELLLTVTDPNGNKVENITGLIHTENGFDITTRTGGFLLVPDYDIEATRGNTTTQEWNVEVTFVNLDTDQVKNMGKSLSGKLYVTRDKMSSYELTKITNMKTTTTYNSITTTLNVQEGSAQLSKYYYGIEKVTNTSIQAISDVKFIEIDKPSYTFSNLDDNSTYKVYSYGIDKNGIKTNTYETEITTNKYNIPKVNSVTHSVTLNSITLSVDATKGDNEIVKYYFSKDNGVTYEESTTNSYVFNNLNDTTEYKIKVKVLDSYGRYSTEYFEAITTETYILPSVTSVTPTTKYNQISVSVVGAKGTNNVAKYYYSIDNKAYVESANATYTFTGLTEKTTHTIKVKVADTQGRMSNEYSLSATTDAYVVPSITNVTTTSTTNSITIKVTGKNGDGTINKYYYSKDNGSNYVESTSNSYTFSNLTSNTTFYIKVYVKDKNNRISSTFTTSVKTKNPTLASFIISQYNGVQGTNNIYHHDGTLENGINDGSYRYSGASDAVNNFVCFGSNEVPCPADNLYRIIGVFGNQVKLIKYDYANSNLLGTDGTYTSSKQYPGANYKGTFNFVNNYKWNKQSSNYWNASVLNNTNLNINYINNIGNDWASKIATTTWKVGGNIYQKIINTTMPIVFFNEITSPSQNATYNAKIGLMYVSDYGFAASPDSWKNTMSSYTSVPLDNWMYMGFNEWTITRNDSYSTSSYRVNSDGYVDENYVSSGETIFYYVTNEYAVRPSFYLTSTVTYASGTGISSDPIRIN